jgi:hypothetical protein
VAAPQHDDAVGDAEDIGHAVADQQHRHALLAQPPQKVEHLRHLPHADRRRRLVHQDDLGLRQMRARDGNGLALAAGHHAHLLGRARLGFQFVKQLTRTLVHGAVVEDAERAEAPHLLARQEDVGRRRQVVAKSEILIDDLDAGSARIDRLVEMDGPAFQQHPAA